MTDDQQTTLLVSCLRLRRNFLLMFRPPLRQKATALLQGKGNDLARAPRTWLDRKPFRRVIVAVELSVIREKFRWAISHL